MTTHRSFITFDDACVSAIMAGTKTQMRRVVRDQHLYSGRDVSQAELDRLAAQCPYGVPGGVLRVIQPRNLTLHITAVRVERLQAITEDDAIAEGVQTTSAWLSHRFEFMRQWELKNGPIPWRDDPWVYVICFRKA